MLLVHGFLVLRESRRSLSVEPVQVVTLCAKVTCTGINGVEIMTRVPRRHGDRHGESKGTSTKISDLKKMVLAYYRRLARPGGKGSILVMSISQFFGSVMSISQFFGSVIIGS